MDEEREVKMANVLIEMKYCLVTNDCGWQAETADRKVKDCKINIPSHSHALQARHASLSSPSDRFYNWSGTVSRCTW